jgi:hypothetical protein
MVGDGDLVVQDVAIGLVEIDALLDDGLVILAAICIFNSLIIVFQKNHGFRPRSGPRTLSALPKHRFMLCINGLGTWARLGAPRTGTAGPSFSSSSDGTGTRYTLHSVTPPAMSCTMTDKPAPPPPRQPLRLPPNCVDRTAERTGTITVIVGATAAASKGTKPG